MNSSPARIAAVTGGLMVAGALLGSVAAVVGAGVAVAVTDGVGVAVSWPILGWAGIIGAVLGAPLLPATSFLLLRRVPLGLSWLGTTLGTMLGGIPGWIAARMYSGNPIVWPLAAAMAGFFLAVLVLRLRFSAGAAGVKVAV